jgi:probable HAF family extracellular repeat protein
MPERWIPVARTWAVAALVALATAAATAQVQRYSIDEVGTLGGPVSAAFGLNDSGVVTGVSATPDASTHGFVWDGGLTPMPPLGGDEQSHGFAITSSGDVAAMSYDLGELMTHGFVWNAGAVTPLGAFAPVAINDDRVVAGYVSFDDTAFGGWVDHAALWYDGQAHDLGTLGGNFSYASAVSPTMQVVGKSFTANDTACRAALWQAGVWHDLGTLGGSNGHAYDIDGSGRIVGVADRADGLPHAFLFEIDAGGNVTARTDLGELGGGTSCAYAINNHGLIVGSSDGRAFLWDGAMVDLNDLLPPGLPWRLDTASAVNNAGQIAGTGMLAGQRRGYLMTLRDAGDMNCDGALDAFDIEPFILALVDPGSYPAQYPNCNLNLADVNDDGAVDAFDIEPFIQLLVGP